MSVKKEACGRRWIQIEVEVPGTPEEVWEAIATGAGISSWSVPAEIEERDGKPAAVKFRFGPGMEFAAGVTAWEPLHKWVARSEGWVPGSPSIAHEWSVESRGGGRCVVRIVQSLFASTDDWDYQLEGAEQGWPAFLRTLRIYLTHFRGARSETMKWMATFPGTEGEAWDALIAVLGLNGVRVGERWSTPAGVPRLGGVVELVSRRPFVALVRLDTPGPGIAALGAFTCGGPSVVALGFYLYGDEAGRTVAIESPSWGAWFQRTFPAPIETGTSD